MFQSTFPQGERRLSLQVLVIITTFQSTFPQGERRDTDDLISNNFFCFNPRSRKGNDKSFGYFFQTESRFNPRSRKGNDLMPVAIETPKSCFNPRSRKGNDADQMAAKFAAGGFNPRSRKGNDACAVVPCGLCQLVSIHVPARGTTSGKRLWTRLLSFQSTFPQGERLDACSD